MSFDPASFAPKHFLWDFADGVGDGHAQPARAQEPADIRQL